MHNSESIVLLPLGIDAFIFVVTSLAVYIQSRKLSKLLKNQGLTNRSDNSALFAAAEGIDPLEFVARGNPFKKENWNALFYLFSPVDEELDEIRKKKTTLIDGCSDNCHFLFGAIFKCRDPHHLCADKCKILIP